jgi:hypothetical protein
MEKIRRKEEKKSKAKENQSKLVKKLKDMEN